MLSVTSEGRLGVLDRDGILQKRFKISAIDDCSYSPVESMSKILAVNLLLAL